MKTLEETISEITCLLLTGKTEDVKEVVKSANWYLRNYRDLLLDMRKVCKDTKYIAEHYLKDLPK